MDIEWQPCYIDGTIFLHSKVKISSLKPSLVAIQSDLVEGPEDNFSFDVAHIKAKL